MAVIRVARTTDSNGQARAFVPAGPARRIRNITGQNIQGNDHVVIQIDTATGSMVYTDERDGVMPTFSADFVPAGSEIIFEHRFVTGYPVVGEQVDIILEN